MYPLYNYSHISIHSTVLHLLYIDANILPHKLYIQTYQALSLTMVMVVKFVRKLNEQIEYHHELLVSNNNSSISDAYPMPLVAGE